MASCHGLRGKHHQVFRMKHIFHVNSPRKNNCPMPALCRKHPRPDGCRWEDMDSMRERGGPVPTVGRRAHGTDGQQLYLQQRERERWKERGQTCTGPLVSEGTGQTRAGVGGQDTGRQRPARFSGRRRPLTTHSHARATYGSEVGVQIKMYNRAAPCKGRLRGLPFTAGVLGAGL